MSSTKEQALDASDYIYQGLWINWGKGRVLGPTITLSPAAATLLTNILALFVTIAGGQAWTVVRFALHQLRTLSYQSASSVTYNKEQVVLRNSTSAISAAQLLVHLGWSSRKHNVRTAPKPRIAPIVLLAIFTATFFLFAGAFSNIVTNAGSTVLSRSPYCGFYNQTYENIVYTVDLSTPETFEMFDESVAKRVQDVEQSLQYAQSCYLMQGTGSSNCDTFKQSSLEVTTSENGTCPFESSMCQSQTLLFDTGLLDSHEHLGINAPAADRLKYRRVTSCTVLNGTGHTTGWVNQTDTSAKQPTWRVAYVNLGADLLYPDDISYSYSNSADFETKYEGQYSMPYKVGHDVAYAPSEIWDPSSPTFEPIAKLQQDKADLNLIYLSFIGTYMRPIEDPWFSAHQVAHINTSVPFLQTTYASDTPVSILGCTEQHQFCTDSTTCTPLLGIDQVELYMTDNFQLTPAQNVTGDRILSAAGDSAMFEIVQSLTSVGNPLLAIDKRLVGNKKTVSLPLPNNQWMMELQYWQSIAMAQLQRVMVEYGTGQISPQPKYLLPPETESQKWICQNLMIRSTVYSSFSVLALTLVIVVGLLVVMLSLTIQSLMTWLTARTGRWKTAREAWVDHDMLGEQRWRLNTTKTATPNSQEPQGISSTKDAPMPPHAQAKASASVSDVKGQVRASSQALSPEDHELLLIARAYGSWV